jgi:lipopolysaccharide/colanic/teichoic acid biosynthesis glycosyltransferase
MDRFDKHPLREHVARYAPAKRRLDLALVLLSLPVVAPLLLIMAALVKAASHGSPVFRQQRIGKNGVPFTLYKFRTLAVQSPAYATHPTAPDDPRITSIGRFLRRTNLDELPQVVNVLRGEMSLVGPRPEMPFIAETWPDEQRVRLLTLPGITGLWQLSPHRGAPIHEHPEYDLRYLAEMSLPLDLSILARTMGRMLTGKNGGKP